MKQLVSLVVLLGAAACGGGSNLVVGQMVLRDQDGWVEIGDECRGDGGYSDIRQGAQVRVSDGSGSLLATSSLEAGERRGRFCDFAFTIEVPDADFYTFEVTSRGELSYSAEELEERGYIVGFELGG